MNPDKHEHLKALLEWYEPSTDLEQKHVDAVVEVLSHPDAFDRTHYAPGHVTASGFVVHPGLDALVLIEHRKLGMWLQPGGHVDSEDIDIRLAAEREVSEETGLTNLVSLGLVDVDVHVFPERGDQPRHLHLDVRHGFLATDDGLVVSTESTGVKWVRFAEVMKMHESLARPARRLRAMSSAGTLRH